MNASRRFHRTLSVAMAVVLLAPTVAYANWPNEPTFEKYSVATGGRTWAMRTEYVAPVAPDASGNLYACSEKGFDVFDTNGTRLRSVDIRGSWGADDIVVGPQGTVYVADADAHRILRYSKTGAYLGAWGSKGTSRGKFVWPNALACSPTGYIYVADSTGRIQKFTSKGAYVRTFAGRGTTAGKFRENPKAMSVDASGTVYTVEASFEEADHSPSRVQRFSSTGKYLGKWNVGGSDIEIDKLGNVFISGRNATHAGVVRRFSRSGTLLQNYFGAQPAGDDGWGTPFYICVDRFGNLFTMSLAAG